MKTLLVHRTAVRSEFVNGAPVASRASMVEWYNYLFEPDGVRIEIVEIEQAPCAAEFYALLTKSMMRDAPDVSEEQQQVTDYLAELGVRLTPNQQQKLQQLFKQLENAQCKTTPSKSSSTTCS